MFQLINPIWLFTLAGISIPVIIHLWNVRQGKTLKIGSIAFLKENSSARSRKIKLSDLLLLLLRCLLVALLALFLSYPIWKQKEAFKKAHGLIFIKPGQFRAAYESHKQTIDSLLKSGYELHEFAIGFKKADSSLLVREPSEQKLEKPVAYWQLAKAADIQFPGIEKVIFTNSRQNQFGWKRPVIHSKIKWYTFAASDSSKTWISDAYLTSTNGIKVITAKSDSEGVSYKTTSLSSNTPDKEINLSYQNGLPQVSRIDNSTLFAVDTSTLKITIYSDLNKSDGNFVAAGIQAFQKISGRRIKVTMANTVQKIPANSDWLFWLSDSKLSERKIKNIFCYAGEKIVNDHDFVFSEAVPDFLPVKLFKIRHHDDVAGEDINWTNGVGRPVLTKTIGSQTVYRFYSRLDPEWNDLVWVSQFPDFIAGLLQPYKSVAPANDIRKISSAQLQPTFSGVDTHENKLVDEKKTDLQFAFWLALLLLFVTERMLANKLSAR
ncbi:hypothetical protein GS399_07505 [Pedobacter sp. HMF7647]|uniref:Aerotolerance regulator N-terminal domain-containing protein n=1 Tax=Hufsiella arboris TaxID=2695275 RepID=A0A7K1Y8B2_9SPHI|nr:BatA domain-containing protein [Hufsiella arboris]MXV50816.1 hypothetical protein [Hufsiella arboris]